MRAMILAAGLGTRLRPLSDWCAKPAMPIRGIPVIAHTLTLLARNDVSEVIVNLHHLPESVRDAVDRFRPPDLAVRYSHEAEILGTGGGMKAAAGFLRESDPSVVLAGDMLVDLDLRAAVARHRARGADCTLLACADDPRAERFGTLGFDAAGSLVRIGQRFDLGGEVERGLFLGIRILSAGCLRDWPDTPCFEDLRDWLAPRLRSGDCDVRVEPVSGQQVLWQPVGTAEEYWTANFEPPALSYLDAIPGEAQATWSEETHLIVGRGARIARGATLERVVVWPGEEVDAGVHARDGVYAGGRFHACGPGVGR